MLPNDSQHASKTTRMCHDTFALDMDDCSRQEKQSPVRLVEQLPDPIQYRFFQMARVSRQTFSDNSDTTDRFGHMLCKFIFVPFLTLPLLSEKPLFSHRKTGARLTKASR